MYDDASYYAFMPSAAPQEDRQAPPKHKRRQSLLQQPNEDAQANDRTLDAIKENVFEASHNTGLPTATLSRRARSYSDFHHAVTSILSADNNTKEEKKKKSDGHEPIKDDLGFADWYDCIEDELLDASHEEYTDYQRQLDLASSHMDSLLSDTNNTLDLLSLLTDSFKTVEAQTTTFQKQCEGLTQEQKRLTQLADGITQNLKYYSFLEPVTRRLNAPTAGSMVRTQEFSSMLARLDECLEYMAVHPKHREASTYRSRYRLLMTRGLTLIRVNFVGGLREIASDVTKRIADRQLNDTTMSALLYAKFRVGASELKEVAQEIRKRAVRAPGAEPGAESEYQSLMNELYTSYSATRGRLVIPLIRKKIGDIAAAPSTSKELVPFARHSIGYIKDMCSSEYDLWREWFEGENGIYDFLESVCEPLYDHLRPRIIHENEILKLCELCTLLQTRYMHDQEDDEPIESNEFDFSVLIQSALEDAQTRLVFRTQAILRDEIERYKPKPDVLDYPANNRKLSLSGTKNQRPRRQSSVAEPTTPMPKTPMIVEQGDSPNGHFDFDTQAAFQGWYPTLRKAIWLLSRIYRLVNSTVFDDLAHQIVHQTTLSLSHASTLILSASTTKNNNQMNAKSPADAHLFLVKHLLLLKQQIVAFDIEYVTPDLQLDFSSLTNTFYELRDRGNFLDPRNIWKHLGGNLMPRVVENMLDAKVELDVRLREGITTFTSSFADRITAPISDTAVSKRGFDAMKAVTQVQGIAQKEAPFLRKKVEEYLDDVRTRETLVSAVQDLVVQRYEVFYENQMREKGKGGKKKGKGREDEVWDVDVFEEWVGDVFQVKRILGREVDDG
ncbi:MAG: hypothetical protein Q9218_007768, partial [Villophora microphyllina]